MSGMFLKEEKGQGAIEYILLAGGIIVAAIVVFSVYYKMTKSMGQKVNETVELAGDVMQNTASNQLTNM